MESSLDVFLEPTEVETNVEPRSSFLRTILFTATAFLGAALLFVVQPLIAKLLLPSYGGSATVWSTSSLFFQVLLLLAYNYAHLSTRRLGGRWQPRAHIVVLLLPLLALPVAIPADAAPPADGSPALWLLRTLAVVIGLPFVVLATTGPLLQRWYSWGGGPRADDPYFLFAASNLGSFGGLLAYPLIIESQLDLASQRQWWTAGFVVFVALTAACALSVRRPATELVVTARWADRAARPRPDRSQVLRWIGLAFLPSSLMLGVTSHISTDVAAIPLLWVVPLGIYLATFVIAFSRTGRTAPVRITRAAVALSFAGVVGSLAAGVVPVPIAIGVNLVILATVALAAHGRLAADRPPTELLTAYYMLIAGGGALGGLLNGLLAPIIFDRVLEYPLALTVVPLLVLGLGSVPDTWLRRQLRANRVRAALILTVIVLVPFTLRTTIWFGRNSELLVLILLVVAGVSGWFLGQIPRIMAVSFAALYVVAAIGDSREVIDQTRTFFGTYSVKNHGGTHELIHGTTIHGTQIRQGQQREEPTTYYSRQGPLGDALTVADPKAVAAIGLGAGTVATYGQPGQKMTFFEIDPEIVRIASDPSLFSYVKDSEADVEMVIGDGRLRIAEQGFSSFDTIILDAFSSDSIPVHLLTEEAMETYADRLTDEGILLVHISNRVFDLEPVVASAANHLGWEAAIGIDRGNSPGATPSTWVAISPEADLVDALLAGAGWSHVDDRRVRWTDDYSSILSVLR